MIYAFSLSPQQIIDRFEHKTASLSARLSSIAAAINAGANVRLCIDPIIYVSEWEEYYCQFIDEVFSKIDGTKIQDVALGTFRISQSYLRKMRQKYPDNQLV